MTPLCQEAVRADQKAFRRLMKFLKEKDGEQHTVLMVQVENDIGFLGADRDYSVPAEEAFAKPVPQKLNSEFAGISWEQLYQ